MLQNNSALKNKIQQLWDKFWSGGISNPLTAIEQITYLLFMRRLDDLDKKREGDAEWSGETYHSIFEGIWIPPEFRDRENAESHGVDRATLRWSFFKNLPADTMLTHVQTKVFPFLKDLGGEDSAFTRHMKNAVFIIPKASLLVEAVETINDIYKLMDADAANSDGQAFQDIQGDVYEYLLSEIATAGKNGQFRTPRHIIKMMAELVQPKLGQSIVDPACGTGGFLLGAYQYAVTQLAKPEYLASLTPDEDGFIRTSKATDLTEEARQILGNSLHGYDIDSTMVRLGLMNLMMHGIDEPRIDYQDTLSKGFTENNKYDLVFANPPFTGSIDKGDINENLTLKTTKTELLFVENIYRLLKVGGTACVILPQGVLFGSAGAFKELRKLLLERCELHAVITMPGGVFKPYAGVSTAILLFTKVWDETSKVTAPATDHVWFYGIQQDGYSLDDKRTYQGVEKSDLPDVVGRYHARNPEVDTDRTQKAFFVPRKDIEAEGYDLSLSRYQIQEFEETHYEEPSVILDKLLQAEIGNLEPTQLTEMQSGIVSELMKLRGLIG